MNILLIEDDKRISDFVIKGLEENGFTVVLAETGEAARDIVSKNDWDIILMDIKMPVMDGYAAMAYLKASDNRVPVIAVTATAHPEEKIRIMSAGFAAYISKPLDKDLLLQTIRQLTQKESDVMYAGS